MSDFGLLNWSSHVTRTFFRKCSTLPNLKLCLTTCSPYRAVRTRWSQNTHHMLQLLRGGDPTAEVVRERDRGVKKPTPTQHSLVHDTHMSRHMTASPATSYSPVPRYDTHAHTYSRTRIHTHIHAQKLAHIYIYIHTTCTQTHTHKHVHMGCTHTQIYTHTQFLLYTHKHNCTPALRVRVKDNARMHAITCALFWYL